MPFLTKQEYAAKCSMTTNSLATEIRRRKIIVDASGMIDEMLPSNRLYYEKRVAKGLCQPKMEAIPTPQKATERKTDKKAPKPLKKPLPIKKRPPDDEDIDDEDEDDDELTDDEAEYMNLADSERVLKHWKAQREERLTELTQIELEKKKGTVVPSAPIIPIVLQHNQYILTAQKNADEEILATMGHKYDFSPEDIAHFRGVMIDKRNAAMRTATEMSDRNLKNLLAEFTEKRKI